MGFFAPDCFRAGMCRRFAMDSPIELALRLSIAARYQWLQTQFSGNDPVDELWRPYLQAVAAHDFAVANRILDLSPPMIDKPNNRAYAAVFAGLHALAKRDEALLRQAIDQSKKGKPKAYVKAISLVLESAAESSAALFAEGLNKMLSSYPKYVYGDEIYSLVDPHAIGLYETCRVYSSDLVAEFDTGRKLPWDSEYYSWLQSCDTIADHLIAMLCPWNFGRCSSNSSRWNGDQQSARIGNNISHNKMLDRRCASFSSGLISQV